MTLYNTSIRWCHSRLKSCNCLISHCILLYNKPKHFPLGSQASTFYIQLLHVPHSILKLCLPQAFALPVPFAGNTCPSASLRGTNFFLLSFHQILAPQRQPCLNHLLPPHTDTVSFRELGLIYNDIVCLFVVCLRKSELGRGRKLSCLIRYYILKYLVQKLACSWCS